MQHLDEGTIHAWLDGALSPEESQRVEAHTVTCEPCSALVAEARGLIAASSRILTALDDVPAGVIPVREGERPISSDDLAAARARKAVAELARRRRWWAQRRILAAAGIVFVAAGTLAVWRQSAFDRATSAAFERAMDSVAPLPAPLPESAPAPPVAGPAVASKSDVQRSGTLGGAAGSRDGRRENEGAASRARNLSADAPREPAPKSRDAVAEADRVLSPSEQANLARIRQAPAVQGRQQAAQTAPAAPTQPAQQQASQRQQTDVRQEAFRDQASRLARSLADSSSRATAVPPAVTTGASERRDASVAKAAPFPALFAGCYEVTPAATILPLRWLPPSIALDTIVAAQRGDSTWYRARRLDTQDVDVELTWRIAAVADPRRPMVEIAARQGPSTESVAMTLERDANLQAAGAAPAKAAEPRSLTLREVLYTARQTSCPRR